MLAKRIIPCLDVHAGRVVKGVNFLNLRDAGDPVDVAARYEQEGADELVFLDITASHEERDIILDVVQRTSEVCFMPLTVGGGIRTLEDIRRLLSAGCDKVSINSAAVTDPDFVREAALRFGLARRRFTDQHHFLIEAAKPWLLSLEGQAPGPATAKRLRQFQTLTHPSMMGQQFKILELERFNA